MSSSCVPPKSGVGPITQEPPSPHQDHNASDDASSDCDSICSCASTSMTSLDASPTTRDLSRLDHNAESSVTPADPPTTDARATTQMMVNSGNPHLVIYISPQVVVPARECSICSACQKQQGLLEGLRLGVVKVCELCPWVAGCVIIYYCFHWWGVGPGFSAFLFMVGVHALIRLVKTYGALECSSLDVSLPQQQSNTLEESVGDDQQVRQDATQDSANEKPPSYEAAVVRPPPYDLHYHLSPAKPLDQTRVNNLEGGLVKTDFLSLPSLVQASRVTRLDEKDDAFLPSYQEAIRLSYRNDTLPMGNQGNE